MPGYEDDGPFRDVFGGWSAWILVPLGVIAVFAVIGIALVSTLGGSGNGSADAATALNRKLPVYWTVKAGDTYSRIAQKTGLTLDDLETFNPNTNPTTIAPGQRIKLRLHVPKAPPKPLGPKFAKVRKGESFGAIAARTGHNINWLLQINKRLKPETLQPGDRVRLRR
jgi:LysM repeat protein